MLALVSGATASRDRNLDFALRAVRTHCPGPNRQINTSMWIPGVHFNALYGNCRAADGRDQRIWFFAGHRFVGTDSRASSRDIVGIWRNDTTIAFMYVLYRASDPNCCPTGGGKLVRFRLSGSGVHVLDPLPRNR